MWEEALLDSRILIVDDQLANIQLLEQILRQAGYQNLITTTDSRLVLDLFATSGPDLILLDLFMPNIDGFELIEELCLRVPEHTYLPILVLTADPNPVTRRRALVLGAKDFLNKPFDDIEVLLRIKNLLETRFLHRELAAQNRLLDRKVRDRTGELEAARIEILERLARAAEYRDDDTGQHTYRVSRSSAQIAGALGLTDDEVERIARAAALHDVGKIGIPDQILLKPGRLSDEEFEIMKSHTTIGAQILSGSRFPLLQLAENIALFHHERWDGSGYPHGLGGEEIPLAARIVAVVDVFDALTHNRPYKSAWPVPEALALIAKESGRHFDPGVAAAFLEVKRSELRLSA
jgi:putative two-component system response regulator